MRRSTLWKNIKDSKHKHITLTHTQTIKRDCWRWYEEERRRREREKKKKRRERGRERISTLSRLFTSKKDPPERRLEDEEDEEEEDTAAWVAIVSNKDWAESMFSVSKARVAAEAMRAAAAEAVETESVDVHLYLYLYLYLAQNEECCGLGCFKMLTTGWIIRTQRLVPFLGSDSQLQIWFLMFQHRLTNSHRNSNGNNASKSCVTLRLRAFQKLRVTTVTKKFLMWEYVLCQK